MFLATSGLDFGLAKLADSPAAQHPGRPVDDRSPGQRAAQRYHLQLHADRRAVLAGDYHGDVRFSQPAARARGYAHQRAREFGVSISLGKVYTSVFRRLSSGNETIIDS